MSAAKRPRVLIASGLVALLLAVAAPGRTNDDAAEIVTPAEVVVQGGRAVAVALLYRRHGASASGLQIDLVYDRSAFSIIGSPGPAATIAGKSVVFSNLPDGRTRIMVGGLNQTVLSDGDLIKLSITQREGGTSAKCKLRLINPYAASPEGESRTIEIR